MYKASTNIYTGLKSCLFIFVTICCVACSSSASQTSSTSPPSQTSTAQLPGQKIWKDGVSSFLFGTNDTYEWSTANIETQPVMQKMLRSAGFTLIRSFFRDGASDADVEKRIQTIENSGAHCLGVITNIFNTSYNEHLVQYLGKRCLMYEFGNEPDYNNIPSTTYIQQWNKEIPLLRHINPQAKFIGPVVAYTLDYIQQFLVGVKASHVLPDAISLHWYPCWQLSEDKCLAKANEVGSIISQVQQIIQNTIGKDLPIGITEWNFDAGNPPPLYGDNKNFITQFTTQALQSMIEARATFACQFDAASYSGYGHLDMFDVNTNQAKPQYYAIAAVIAKYKPSSSS